LETVGETLARLVAFPQVFAHDAEFLFQSGMFPKQTVSPVCLLLADRVDQTSLNPHFDIGGTVHPFF
jgi:hypothetical protein